MAKEVAIIISNKLLAHLERLADLEGYGDTPCEVIQRLVWDRVNELIASGRLSEPREHTGEK